MMNAFTFLGCGNNALSMFIEILVAKYEHDFNVVIIKNLKTEDKTPFLPPGVTATEKWFEDYEFTPEKKYIIGVNKPLAKKSVFDFFCSYAKIDFDQYQILVHPSAVVASTSLLGVGVIINPGVVAAPFSKLGKLVSLNRNVTIGHHTIIDDFTTVHPGGNIAGHCHIGKNVTIGMGANIIDGINIGDNAVVGAGALVTKNVEANTLVMGVPAKLIERK
jgi:sugar O-acyltransferase (sialic acid O-acetyltransferase NeuD family)